MRNALHFYLPVALTLITGIAQAQYYGGCNPDYIPPTAVCDAHTVVALTSNGTATVYASSFDDGSHDNCGISHFKAARMWPGYCPYGIVADTQFRPYVQFCCNDVGAGPIWIIVRVFDFAGNYNECMVTVTVQAGSGTLHCPPDKTIKCDYWFSWNDLFDPWNTFFGWPTSGGACGGGANVSVQVFDHRNQCGTGHIKRVFTLTGGGYGGGYGYGQTQCIQFIWVINPHHFQGHHIQWPKHYEVDGCHIHNIHPNSLPHGFDKPRWTAQQCSMLGYSWSDKTFYFAEGACKKILRHWTVIDWCKYNPNYPHSGGIWEYIQVIKLKDKNKPQIENCKDITVGAFEDGCKAKFIHDPMAWDDCTPADKLSYEYKIDLYANGSFDIIRKGPRTIHEFLPVGKHKVFWFIDDNCGNLSSCSFFVTIVDKKAPTPVCYAQLSTVVMPQNGKVTIWAKDFDASSFDNCTPRHLLKFSFSSNPHEASRIFTCDDLGLNALQIWVTDQSGNQAFCNTFLTIDDNSSFCDMMNIISGDVNTFTGHAVAEASVEMYKVMPDASLLMDKERKTQEDGSYQIGFGTTKYNRKIAVVRDVDPLEGITTLDLIYLQRHILGIETLTHPAALKAADVDGSGRVGIGDLIMLRDAFLSGGRTLQNKSMPWVFYPANCQWDDEGELMCPTKVEIDHTAPPSDPVLFEGYKVGDINGDILSNMADRSAYRYPVEVRYDRDKRAYLFIAGDHADLLGMQLSFYTNLGFFTTRPLHGGVLNAGSQNAYADTEAGMVNFAWITPSARRINRGDVLFEMPLADAGEVDRKEQSAWSTGAFRNELYLPDKTPIPVEIRWAGMPETHDEAVLESRNAQHTVETVPVFAPNPMHTEGVLYFSLAMAQSGAFEIYTPDQKMVISEQLSFSEGHNEVYVKASQLGTGVYVYRLRVGDQIHSGRIVVIQ